MLRRPAPPDDRLQAAAIESAAQGGLVHVSDADQGLHRRRTGRGFAYLRANGKPVRDRATLERIRTLAIPPAYRDVWICAQANGHLQATGRDARGRKQYRYHPRWRQVRDSQKFDRMLAFGAALPQLRRRLRADLAREGLERERVLALVVAVLADTLVRVGNDEYARDNRSFGLTTLRDHHAAFLRGGGLRFRFRGKGGQEQEVVLDDARLAKLVRRCQQLPGQQLFQYLDDAGNVQPVGSGEVNDYLRDAMGGEFTAKDFRTWAGTLCAFRLLGAEATPGAAGPDTRSAAAIRNQVIAAVAGMLRNTPAICRKSYIDPAVFEAWQAGRLTRTVRGARGPRQWEQALMRLLRGARRRASGGS